MKKNIMLLTGLLALSIIGQLMLRPCLGSQNDSATPPSTDHQTQVPNQMSTQELLEEVQQSDNRQTGGFSGGLYRQLTTMIAIVAAMGAAVWIFCKKMPGRWKNAKGKNIMITETVGLGPRKHLHVVQLGDKQYLIASTTENIRLLADVTGTLETNDE